MNISVIGTGYVGLVTGACFAEFGLNVACVDVDEEKIAKLNQGKVPIYEPGLDSLVEKNLSQGRLSFTTDVKKAVERSLVIFIAVGTPSCDDGSANLVYIDEVARSIAENMDGYKVIATKSTVPVGTGRRIKRIIEENQKERVKFSIVANPEFLREGNAIEDFIRPDRLVIGTEDSEAIAIMKDLYSPLYFIEIPFVITDIESAELIKYASNSFLALKISFINEMALLCEKMGADVHHVVKGMGLDQRIGPKFLHPGPGYGGSCFPKDTKALTQLAIKHGIELKIINSVIDVNERQKMLMVNKIKEAVGDPKGKTLGVLGLSFKPDTDDMREAPAITIIRALQAEGAKIKAFDPVAMDNSKRFLQDLHYCNDTYEVAEGSDALVFMTEWNQFRKLDLPRIKSLLSSPIIIDLKNIYEPEVMNKLGFSYFCVGRGKNTMPCSG